MVYKNTHNISSKLSYRPTLHDVNDFWQTQSCSLIVFMDEYDAHAGQGHRVHLKIRQIKPTDTTDQGQN